MNYKIIKADIQTASLNISPYGNPTNDECMYNIAAYHAQQAIEKCLKYYLHDVYGVDDSTRRFRTHNISTLLLDLSAFDPLFIEKHPVTVSYADDLSMWEATSRYGDSLVATRHMIEEVLQDADIMYRDIAERELQREKCESERENNDYDR